MKMIARVAELPLAYEPGMVIHYSIGFDVMAVVIERYRNRLQYFSPKTLVRTIEDELNRFSSRARRRQASFYQLRRHGGAARTLQPTGSRTLPFRGAGVYRTNVRAVSG